MTMSHCFGLWYIITLWPTLAGVFCLWISLSSSRSILFQYKLYKTFHYSQLNIEAITTFTSLDCHLPKNSTWPVFVSRDCNLTLPLKKRLFSVNGLNCFDFFRHISPLLIRLTFQNWLSQMVFSHTRRFTLEKRLIRSPETYHDQSVKFPECKEAQVLTQLRDDFSVLLAGYT